ncbi:SusC/RagA family TonB-linked outer membrane protein [Olivibacter sp. CPCC 100613]|uniref:SusC/RagA family TonB-linked outer membrane protein n=1 Tax=Olivibacter sp. CPCC 100613 TaxID=3079931 RepID=UPI002FFC1B5B
MKKNSFDFYLFISLKNGLRLIVLFFVFIFFTDQAAAQSITLKKDKSPLLEILREIQHQSKLDLFGDFDLLKGVKPFSIDVKNRDLAQVLHELSDGQPFSLSLYRDAIVIEAAKLRAKEEKTSKLLSGTVKDENGFPLENVNIRSLIPPYRAVTTQSDGSYQIRVDTDQELLFSMVGYEPLRLKLNGEIALHVQLKSQQQMMEEVLIHRGYDSRKPLSMTGASRSITRRELEQFNSNNIFTVIQSIDPTFHIDQNLFAGSNPNIIPDVTIRGINNVGEYAINSPLVILDGFEVSLERLYDLDINRIESITLLKDVSSTVLYGSRGGNGVLVVETRPGTAEKLTLSYDMRSTVTAVDVGDYHLMNAAEKLDFEKLAGVYTVTAGTFPPAEENIEQARLDNLYNRRKANMIRGVETDWLSQPTHSSLSLAHSIRAEGGVGRIRYGIQGNYNNLAGAMKGSGRRRIGSTFDLVYRKPQKILLRNNLTYLSNKAYQSPYGPFSRYAQMNPYQPLRNESGDLVRQYADESLEELQYNPLYDAGLPHRADEYATILTNNFSLEWNISPVLKLRSTAVLEKNTSKSEFYLSPLHSRFARADQDSIGQYSSGKGNGNGYSANVNITYFKTRKKHAFSTSLIGEVKSSSFKQDTRQLIGFTADLERSSLPKYAKSNQLVHRDIENRLLGVLFVGNYTYDQKYILDASYRMDGSSKFGENARYGNFWSLGLGYNLHQEHFFKRDWIQELRLFTNTGVNGTDAFLANMTLSSYVLSPGQVYYKEFGLSYFNEGNPDLHWPQIHSWSVGGTGKLFDGRIAFSYAYYSKVTDRMISLITVAPSVGLPNDSYFENMGKVQNRGFEAAATIKVMENSKKTLSWYLTASANRNQGKLIEISEALRQLNASNLVRTNEGLYKQTVYYEQGKSINNIKGVRSLGIDPASGQEIFQKINGRLTNEWDINDITVIGNREPKLFGNIHSAFNFRQFSLQAYFSYTLGGDIYNHTLADRVENSDPRLNTDIRAFYDRWRQPGDQAAFKDIRNVEKTGLTSRFVQRENTLQLSCLMINYDFLGERIKKYRLQRLRLNFSVNGLLRISTVKMERGLDYPFARTFNIGCMIQF